MHSVLGNHVCLPILLSLRHQNMKLAIIGALNRSEMHRGSFQNSFSKTDLNLKNAWNSALLQSKRCRENEDVEQDKMLNKVFLYSKRNMMV